LKAISDAGDDLHLACAALHRVVSSSQVGSQLFSFALLKELACEVGQCIDQHAKTFAKGAMTVATLNVAKFNTLEAVDRLANVALLPVRRSITVEHGNEAIVSEVTSITAEISIRFASFWKEAAVLQKKLGPMWCEDALELHHGVSVRLDAFGLVDPELCQAAVIARDDCKQVFTESGYNTSDTMLQLLRTKKVHWKVMDPDFALEIAMVESLCSSGSEHRLVHKMFRMFPTTVVDIPVEDVLQQVHSLTTSSMYKMATRGAQAKHGLVTTMLGRIVDGRPPALHAMALDALLVPIVNALKFFVRKTEAASSGTAGKHVRV
jgi:hypothetical protein